MILHRSGTLRCRAGRSLSLRPHHPAKPPTRPSRQLQASPAASPPITHRLTHPGPKRPSQPPSTLSPPPLRHASTTPSPVPPHSPPPSPPQPTGLLALLPPPLLPYAELARLDKQAGTTYLFLPCLFSSLLAASHTLTPPTPLLTTTLLFYTGALLMRSLGCTINDLWDRRLDALVTRTRLRPLARGALTPSQALVFAAAQALAGLGVLLQFPAPCLYYGVPSLVLVALYPLAKRVTHYPQVVLGLTFSWGALMGWPALGVDLLSDGAARAAAAALYASCVAWTVGLNPSP